MSILWLMALLSLTRAQSRDPQTSETIGTREKICGVKSTPDEIKYYMFDWDDNILSPPTTLSLWVRPKNSTLLPDEAWNLVELTTKEFAVLRGDPAYELRELGRDGDWEKTFVNFGDRLEDQLNPSSSVLFRDSLQAIIHNRLSPSYFILKKALVEGRLFAVITARGHSEAVFRSVVRALVAYILTPEEQRDMVASLRTWRRLDIGAVGDEPDSILIDKYFEACRFFNVQSEEFKYRYYGPEFVGKRLKTEDGKAKAMRVFVEDRLSAIPKKFEETYRNLPVSFGVSDDDLTNLAAFDSFVPQIAAEFRGVRFVVYDTSDGKSCLKRSDHFHPDEAGSLLM